MRPWLTTGIALVSVGVIAASPITPTPPALLAAAPTISAPAIHATAFELPYLLTLPIVRQYVSNVIENWAVYLGGFAKAGAGLTESIVAIPQTLATITQQLLALDLVGAFNTLGAAITDAVIAVGQPLLNSWIERRQKVLAVETAMQAAVPAAFLSVVNGALAAANGVTTSVIVGTQNLVAAVATLDLGNIVTATVDGTKGFAVSLAAGAGDIVTGIEGAQLAIATALATPAPGAATTTPAVDAVPELGKDKLVTLSVTSADETTPLGKGTTRSTTKTLSGQGISEVAKRAAHHATGLTKKPATSKSDSAKSKTTSASGE